MACGAMTCCSPERILPTSCVRLGETIKWCPDFKSRYSVSNDVLPTFHKGTEVRLGQRVSDGFHVVVKARRKADCFHDAQEEADWRRSTKLLLNLPHNEGLVRTLEVLEDDKAYYVVMDRVSGLDLCEILRREGKPLPVPDVKEVLRLLLEALAGMHGMGLIHKDMKLENVMVDWPEWAGAPSRSSSVIGPLPSQQKISSTSSSGGSTRAGSKTSGSLSPRRGILDGRPFASLSPRVSCDGGSFGDSHSSRSPGRMLHGHMPNGYNHPVPCRLPGDARPEDTPATGPRLSRKGSVLWEPTRGQPVVKVIDFDTLESKAAGACDLETFRRPSGRTIVKGTDQYLAPETYTGTYSRSSDIFAVGVMAYVMLTGCFPFAEDVFVCEQGEYYVGSPKMLELRDRLRNYQIDWNHLAFQQDQVAADLVQRMLHPDKASRPSCRGCLNHQWMVQGHLRRASTITTLAADNGGHVNIA